MAQTKTGTPYYSALLLHKDNEDHDTYLQLYQQFILQLTDKYQ